MGRLDKYKPVVSRQLLIALAGVVWVCVGIMLLAMALSWLSVVSGARFFTAAGMGIGLALIVRRFGFVKIVDRNVARLLSLDDKACVFAFIPGRSYLIIALMVAMGITLRHSSIPKPYLAVVYICMGLALILSSARYLTVFLREIRQ